MNKVTLQSGLAPGECEGSRGVPTFTAESLPSRISGRGLRGGFFFFPGSTGSKSPPPAPPGNPGGEQRRGFQAATYTLPRFHGQTKNTLRLPGLRVGAGALAG